MQWRNGSEDAAERTRKVLLALFAVLTVVIAVLSWRAPRSPYLFKDWAYLQGSLTVAAFATYRARPETLRRNAVIYGTGFVVMLALAQLYFSR